MKIRNFYLLLCWMFVTAAATTAHPLILEEKAQSADSVPSYVEVLKPKVEQLRKEMMIPGLIVYIESERFGDWKTTFGTRDFEQTEPLEVTDYFRVGSTTKTWIGTLVLQLVEEGKLKLSDPIGNYIDGVPNGDEITIEHLMSMRSGLVSYTEVPLFVEMLDIEPKRVWQPQELLDYAFGVEDNVSFSPGEKFEYCNTNTVLLGIVVEKLTGQKLDQLCHERIFSPLGLSHTYFPPLESIRLPEPHSKGYLYGTNLDRHNSTALLERALVAVKEGKLSPNDLTDNDPSWAWAAGSGVSTAPELARFMRAQVMGGLVSSDLQKRRIESIAPTGSESFPPFVDYGLCLMKSWDLYGHGGDIDGHSNFNGYDPMTGTTIIVFSNLRVAPDGRPTALTVAQEIVKELYK